METGELACEKRALDHKHPSRALRRAGRVPAILYGPASAATPLTVDGTELKARVAAAARMRLIKLKSNASELDGKHVIFKDLQRAPVSGDIIHADLYEVDLKRPLRVAVPLKFTGKAKGTADGGILQPLERAATVLCLPLEIPEFIEVDVTDVGIHDVIHVSSVKFPANIKPIFETDYPVVTVLPPTVAEVAVAPAAAEAVEGAPAEGAAEGAAPAAEGAAGKEAAGAKKPEAAGKKAEAAPAKK
ncbi:MAG TPA: 50S ribosomal protein L25 [Candidatus Binataceae bacterium]|nr:50S ribosomal protein L25 [Candidatus Binataceae bacterium]